MVTYHHLSYDERLEIERLLKGSLSLNQIVANLKRVRKTIAYEIQKNRMAIVDGGFKHSPNIYAIHKECRIKNVVSRVSATVLYVFMSTDRRHCS